MQSEPRSARTSVWALSLSLAATHKIDVSFSSSGYLDVSVHRVPLHTLCVQIWIHEVFSCGFPHSDICGSMCICHSPQLFAAYHVFLRLLVPRHPPCALYASTYHSVLIFYGLRFTLLHALTSALQCIHALVTNFSDVLIIKLNLIFLIFQYEVFKVQCA